VTGDYFDLSVQVVPVIAAGFTVSVAGDRSMRLGRAVTVAAKMEMNTTSFIFRSRINRRV
jgi:hypothetical protein